MKKLIILFLAIILTGCSGEDPKTAELRGALELFYYQNGHYRPAQCNSFQYGPDTFVKCNAGDRYKPWGALYQLVQGPDGLSVATVNGKARTHMEHSANTHGLVFDNGTSVPRAELIKSRNDIDKIYEASIK